MTRPTTASGHKGLQFEQNLIFEQNTAGATAVDLPALAHDLDTPADYDAVKSAP